MDRTAIIILAGGDSSRLGRPKQTLYYNGKSLLQHAADAAIGADLGPVMVVTGANEQLVLHKLDARGLTVVNNPDWQQGMGTGIRKGIESLYEENIASVIISVCDQPFISSDIFVQLVDAKQHSGKGIVASAYGNTLGVPALFDKKYFPRLRKSGQDEGAKQLIFEFAADVARIDFQAGVIDIDTDEDYNILLDQSSDHSLQ